MMICFPVYLYNSSKSIEKKSLTFNARKMEFNQECVEEKKHERVPVIRVSVNGRLND